MARSISAFPPHTPPQSDLDELYEERAQELFERPPATTVAPCRTAAPKRVTRGAVFSIDLRVLHALREERKRIMAAHLHEEDRKDLLEINALRLREAMVWDVAPQTPRSVSRRDS